MNDPRPPRNAAAGADVAARVQALVRPEIRAISAYHVAKAGGMIKLDANENPHGLSAEARADGRGGGQCAGQSLSGWRR
ncbi:MAG: hypothetical protein ABI777_02895 [Betaproteobacteria bacterium]